MSPEINLKGHCKRIPIKLYIRNSYSITPTLKHILVGMRIFKMWTTENASADKALEYAIDAIENGKIKLGTEALEWVLKREPDNRVAWLWMACTVVDEEKKRACYKQIG